MTTTVSAIQDGCSKRVVRRSRLQAGSLTFAFLLASRLARADDISDLSQLLGESVVSGASKSAETSSDAPATTTTITASDMQRYGIRSIAEAINFLGMGLITEDPLHSVEIGGRGVLLTADFGDHVLLVVDGHTMNEPWDGTAYFEQGAGIPLELIDHIELILGPGSVLYGGNAMFGVVNVVTRRASSYEGLHVIAEGSASPQQGRNGELTSFAPANLGGSYRIGAGYGHAFQLAGKDAEVIAHAELYEQNGPSFLWGPQLVPNAGASVPPNHLFGPNTPVTTLNGTSYSVWGGRTEQSYMTRIPTGWLKFNWGDLAVFMRGEINYRKTPYMNEFNVSLMGFDDPRAFEQDRWLSMDAQYRKQLSERFNLFVHLYGDSYDWQQIEHSSQPTACSVTTINGCSLQVLGVSRWIGVEGSTTFDWFGDDRYTTMGGLDTRVRDVGGKTDSLDDVTGQDFGSVGAKRATEGAAAAFVQQRLQPVNWLHINGGARADFDTRAGEHLSPRLAAAADTWKGGTVKVIYSEAFRAPSFYEEYYAAPNQLANPHIKAETVRGVEGTLEQKWGTHHLLFGLFATKWLDMIQLLTVDPTTGIQQYQNASTIDNYGYNGRIDGALGNFHYGASLTGAYTRRNMSSGPTVLTVAPSLFGNARVMYSLEAPLPSFGLATSYIGTRPADRALDGGFTPPPYAPQNVTLQATMSGGPYDLSHFGKLSYRVGGTFNTASQSAYVAGPIQYASVTTPDQAAPELAPINRLTAFATLRYDFAL